MKGLTTSLVLASLATAALANDSASELAAGGLVLVATDAIAMQREDLSLSPAEVKVRYEMLNVTGQPVTLRVAFPMPEVPSETPGGLTTSQGGYNILMTPPTDPNFIGFRVTANGQPIQPKVEIKALVKDRDVARELGDIGGLKLVLQPGLFMEDEKPLGPGVREKLKALGVFEQLDKLAYRLAWTTLVTFHWQQTFAPGVTVVEHVYKPIVGARFVVAQPGRPIAGSGAGEPGPTFCIDPTTEQAIRALAAETGRDNLLNGQTLGYVLKTARNWKGGKIGTFHLALQGAPETRVTSLCTDLPLARTGPNRFEATVNDYAPKDDLKVLFVSAPR